MAKVWVDADEAFRTNTDAEIRYELYGGGITAKYTKRIAEINAILAAEKAKKAGEEKERV